jgi:hypothetical protein
MENQQLRRTLTRTVATACLVTPCVLHAQDFPRLPANRIVETSVFDADHWTLQLIVEIGSITGEGPDQFFRITDARQLDSTSVMIANSGSGEVRVFDFSGRHLRSFGGSGKGPGEFTHLAGLHLKGDTVLAIDYSPRQVSFFDRGGRFLRVVRFAEGADVRWPTPLGFLADGRVIAVNGQTFESGQMGVGLVRPPFEILELPAAGTGSAKLIATFPGTEFWVTREPDQLTTKSLLGPETMYAVGGSAFWLASSDSYSIWRFSVTGEPELLIRVPLPARRPARGDIENRIEERLRQLPPGPARDRTLASFRAMPAPERRPVVQGLVASSSGELWVSPSQSAAVDSVTWHVFDREGRLSATITTPARFQITEVSADRVIGIWRNELDVESVRVYAITER